MIIKIMLFAMGVLANVTTVDKTTVVDVEACCEAVDVVAVDDGADVWEFYGTDYHEGDDVVIVRIGDCVVYAQ